MPSSELRQNSPEGAFDLEACEALRDRLRAADIPVEVGTRKGRRSAWMRDPNNVKVEMFLEAT